MCLGYPGRIESLNIHEAIVDVAGTKRQITTIMLGDTVSVGDWVMVHAGYAMAKMEEDEAKEALEFLMDFINEDDEPK